MTSRVRKIYIFLWILYDAAWCSNTSWCDITFPCCKMHLGGGRLNLREPTAKILTWARWALFFFLTKLLIGSNIKMPKANNFSVCLGLRSGCLPCGNCLVMVPQELIATPIDQPTMGGSLYWGFGMALEININYLRQPDDISCTACLVDRLDSDLRCTISGPY